MSAQQPVTTYMISTLRSRERLPEVEGLSDIVEDGDACRDSAVIQFRRFRVLLHTRTLLCEGRNVPLGSRAFDLLTVLLQSRGTMVTKDRILSHVWPSTLVEESNLRFQMTLLRRALGKDRDVIKTIPGRGYLFIAEPQPSTFGMRPLTDAVSYPPSLTAGPSPTSPYRLNSIKPGSKPHDVQRTDVVVIDDDEDIRESLQSLLRSTGLRVEHFASVEEFIASSRSAPPKCLILDVWMPGRNGLDFQSDLSNANIHLPIIFISGHADVHMCAQAMKAGAIDFLTKPVRYQDLLDAVDQAISTAAPCEASL
jgi:DNA-binding response OmpR family regulator